jgi:ELWxxDGT repeat protein
MRKRLAVLMLVGPALAGELAAQPTLLRDINSTASGGDSSPQSFVSLEGLAYFWSHGPDGTAELWRSAGTPESTERVAACPDCGDFVPQNVFASPATGRVYSRLSRDTFRLAASDGTEGGTEEIFTSRLAAISWDSFLDLPERGLTLFFVDSPWAGPEIWATDGTRAGTRPVQRIVRPAYPQARSMLVLGGFVYFIADDGVVGPALWRSDGTPAGTSRVADLVPRSRVHPAPQLLAAGPRFLFLAGWTREHGEEAWVSDGTAAGTRRIADLVPGSKGSRVLQARAVGNQVFFVADSGRGGQELHAFDGRRVRTVSRFRHSQPLADPATPSYFDTARALGDRLVFDAFELGLGAEPWVSDGTLGGTRILGDLCPGPCGSQERMARFALGDELIFHAALPEIGIEPWITDGTPAGTRLLRDLCRGPCSSRGALLGAVDGVGLVGAEGPDGQFHLWRTDGTGGGTRRVFVGNRQSSGALGLGDLVLLGLDDGTTGEELWAWRPDAQFEPVSDLLPGTGDSLVCGFASTGEDLYFLADDGVHGVELWTSRGSSEDTRLLAEVEAGPGPHATLAFATLEAVEVGARTLVSLSVSEPQAWNGLWSTDGTAAGTFRLGAESPVTLFQGRGYFAVYAEDGSTSLYSTDGTLAGTLQVAPAPGPVRPGVILGGRMIYVALRDFPFASPPVPSQFEIWSTDGTAAGTRLLKVAASGAFRFTQTAALAGRVYFTVSLAVGGSELWSTDGTPGGTVQATGELFPFNSVTVFAPLAGHLAFTGGQQSATEFLAADRSWSYDPDTGEVSELLGVRMSHGQVFAGALYFANADPEAVLESQLWRTDGTLEGTVSVRTAEGQAILGAHQLEIQGDRLLSFSAGVGAWETDGTPEGTRELYLGGSPCPAVGAVGGRWVIARSPPETGREPWLLEP